jgi:hypothetical protein
MSQSSSLSSTTNICAIVHVSSTVIWFPARLPERCGVAASAYQVPIAHVDGERREALSPPVAREGIACKACARRRLSLWGSDEEMAA